MRSLFCIAFLLLFKCSCCSVHAADNRSSSSAVIRIVAAENFYGSIAQQIGGKRVVVVSIMNNLRQDPHEFQPTAGVAKEVADADIVIKNGLGYDSWIDKLIATKGNPNRIVINVAGIVKRESQGRSNPHLWYNPNVMMLLAERLAQILQMPSSAASFRQELQPLFEKMEFLKGRYPNLPVTATEPLFLPMAEELGWKVFHEDYQWSIMNEVEPSFQQVANFQESLKNRKVRLLFYNRQVTNPSTLQLQRIAEQNNIPMIGITELQPLDAPTYQAWMLSQLNEIEHALKK